MRTMRSLAVPLLAALGACAAPEAVHREAPGALGPYSASVAAGGLVFVSGQIAPAPEFAAEAEGALRKVEAELARCGLSLRDVVSCTVYLTDMGLYREFNAVYARVVPAPHPARACVAVAALPGGARVEVQVVASTR